MDLEIIRLREIRQKKLRTMISLECRISTESNNQKPIDITDCGLVVTRAGEGGGGKG